MASMSLRRIVGARAVDGLDELASDGRQVEVEEVRVRPLQVVHQGGEREVVLLAAVRVGLVADEVGYGQKGLVVHPLCLADVLHRTVAEAQRQAEAAHHHQ